MSARWTSFVAACVATVLVASPAAGKPKTKRVTGQYKVVVSAPDGTVLASDARATVTASTFKFNFAKGKGATFLLRGANEGKCGDDQMWAGITLGVPSSIKPMTIGADGSFTGDHPNIVLTDHVVGKFKTSKSGTAVWTLTLPVNGEGETPTCDLGVKFDAIAKKKKKTN